MRELSGRQAEGRLEVRQQHFPLGVRLDGFQHLLVDRDLVGLALLRRLVGLKEKSGCDAPIVYGFHFSNCYWHENSPSLLH